MNVQLYGHPFSSYTWKVLIALYANDTKFAFHQLGPDDGYGVDFLRRVHPAGKFPVLVDGEEIIIETSAIIEHLAAHHPGVAALIPADPEVAVAARMLDRVFDSYVMGNMQRVIAAHFVDPDDPGGKGLREIPNATEIAAGQARLRQAYAWLEHWLATNRLPPHVSLVTCSAAPSLFYADWVEPIPDDCARLTSLRAELLALPAVVRCVEDARPYRAYFPFGAPDRD